MTSRSKRKRDGVATEAPISRLSSFWTTVRGTRFCDVEGVVPGEILQSVRQPDNPADKNAVALHRRNAAFGRVGYLPRDVCSHLTPYLDTGRITLSVSVRDVHAARPTSVEIRIDVHVNVAEGCDAQTRQKIEMAMGEAARAAQGSFSSRILCENAAVMLKDVMRDHGHLLSREEIQIYRDMLDLDAPATALLLRLYVRKGTWFRLKDLNYLDPEILDPVAEMLIRQEFFGSSGKEPHAKRLVLLASTLTAVEIKRLLKYYRSQKVTCRIDGNKARLLKELERVLHQNEKWIDALESVTGKCVCVTWRVCQALNVAERLYFLNTSQDLTSFLLQELNVVKWPKYRTSTCHQIFPDRRAFDDYQAALRVASVLESSSDAQEVEACLGTVWNALERNWHKMAWSCHGETDAMPNEPLSWKNPLPLFLARFSAAWIFVKAASIGIALLEKRHSYGEAVEKLRSLLGGNACPACRGSWWIRLIVDLQHLKRFNAALEACTSALADSWVRHGNRISIKRQVLKLSKPPRRWKLPAWAPQLKKEPSVTKIYASPIDSIPGIKSQYIGKTGGPVGVEQLALEFYEVLEHGSWKGTHTEGSVWHTMFGILFWDIIFSNIEDVFRSPFQSAPLDFATDAFYLSRRSDIHRRLDLIRKGDFCQLFKHHWNEHQGEMCLGVHWDRYGCDTYLDMMKCIGGCRLASICQILAEDYKAVSGGLPDLFLWNDEKGICKLVEVKGPNDRLSDQQRAWITTLHGMGFDVEVFKVEKRMSS